MLAANQWLIKGRGQMLNWGIDFRGGTELTVDFSKDVDPGKIRSALDKSGYPNSDIVRINDPAKVEYLLRLGRTTVLSPEKETAARAKLLTLGDATVKKFDFPEGGDKFYIRYDKNVEPADVQKALTEIGLATQQVQRYGRP